ncbi:CobW family GTP-binding protein [Halomonas salipaludis]|uniref:Cobalamin biosynthesis protein CobW n=1 Tax=Halomonas salipaludis TaxID=2032625 RepID=A0A2A2ENE9_9GAMM|nr:GTP-binding protein [Halomonas salipaludis]PAU74050.1 cobalamin biosynthesis protein CobW [Halomonas salipaludis]
MSDSPSRLLPVNVISGFLGSGKTTLLKAVLESESYGDTAVLINEYGEVGFDNLLLGKISEDVVLLKSGCVCCTIRGELSEALLDLLYQREEGLIPPFKRVIIETTGLASPGPIASTITADSTLRYHIRPGATVTVVDAINAQQSQQDHFVWAEQVAAADKLVMSKAEMATHTQIEEVTYQVQAINPTAVLLGSDAQAQPSSELFEDGPHIKCWKPEQVQGWLGPKHRKYTMTENEHLHGVQSFRLRFQGAVDWTCFGIWLSMLLNRHGRNILRVKGVLHVHGDPRPVVLHGVQHTIHPPEHIDDWPKDQNDSNLIFITRGLDGAAITSSLNEFMSAISEHPLPRILHE